MKRVLFVLGALCASLWGQSCPAGSTRIETSYGSYCRNFSSSDQETSNSTHDDGVMFDCSKLPEPSAGCKSYNEMVRSGDKALRSTLNSSTTTFVCFRPYEDVFITISYEAPSYNAFVKNEVSKLYETSGLLWYARYKQGVLDDSQVAGGKWKKYLRDGQEPSFVPDPKSVATSLISDSEVVFGYTFQNLSSTKTFYRVDLRRSTLRFVETYQWDNPPRAKIKKGSTDSSEEPATKG